MIVPLITLLALLSTPDEAERLESVNLLESGLRGWVTAKGQAVEHGWRIEDGVLSRESWGGSIFTKKSFRDFELTFEWKIAKGGNSGLKYRMHKHKNSWLGCEFQILDDQKNAFSKHATGSLYALYPPSKQKKPLTPGRWNTSKIIVFDKHVEHWLNGVKVVDCVIGGEDWEKRRNASKFRKHPDFGRHTGPIMLQDHGSKVSFRKLVIVPLRSKK